MSTNNPPPSSFDGNEGFYETSRTSKLLRRLREEPLVPIGCALTCWALLGATKSIRRGNHHEANRMFRRRIYAQGFTIIAMVVGSVYYTGDREKRKELEGIMSEQKRKEKHERWVRELEARDEEDKAMKEMMRRKLDESQNDHDVPTRRTVVEELERRRLTPRIGILEILNLR